MYIIIHLQPSFFKFRNPKKQVNQNKLVTDNKFVNVESFKVGFTTTFFGRNFWHPQSFLGWKYPKDQRKNIWNLLELDHQGWLVPKKLQKT